MPVYFACVLKHTAAADSDSLYDVGIICGRIDMDENSQITDLNFGDYGFKAAHGKIDGREIIYSERIISDRRPDNTQMNKYMKWKIGHCQINIDGLPARAHRGLFTNVKNDLAWILSVLKVEVDFHLGAQECMRAENRQYIKAYQNKSESGYGPEFLIASKTDHRCNQPGHKKDKKYNASWRK